MRTGGLSAEKAYSEDVQDIMHKIRAQAEEKLGRAVTQFILVSYKTQVVAGMNYFAKIDIGEDDLLHVRVYRDLSQNVSLESFQHPKARQEEISYF